jgi:hypothetical protein
VDSERAVMQPELVSALAPVLRDLAATASIELDVSAGDWGYEDGPSAMVSGPSGGSTGVAFMDGLTPAERIASVADQVQEIVIEELWHARRSATWPQCPLHPDSHPLEAIVIASRAVWRCPKSTEIIEELGALGSG